MIEIEGNLERVKHSGAPSNVDRNVENVIKDFEFGDASCSINLVGTDVWRVRFPIADMIAPDGQSGFNIHTIAVSAGHERSPSLLKRIRLRVRKSVQSPVSSPHTGSQRFTGPEWSR